MKRICIFEIIAVIIAVNYVAALVTPPYHARFYYTHGDNFVEFNPEQTSTLLLGDNDRTIMKELLIAIPGKISLSEDLIFENMLQRLAKSKQTIVILVDYMHDSRFSRLDDLSTMIEVTEICLKAYLGLFQHHNQHRITLTFFTHGLGAVIAANTGMAIHRAVGNDVYVKYIFAICPNRTLLNEHLETATRHQFEHIFLLYMNTLDQFSCTERGQMYSPQNIEYSEVSGKPVLPNIGEGLAFIIEQLESSIGNVIKEKIYHHEFVMGQELHSVTSVDIFNPMPELATRMTVIRADFHQSDKKFHRTDFPEVAQCTAIAMVTCALDETMRPDQWTTKILNEIINVGDSVYRRVRAENTNMNLGVDEIDKSFWFNGVAYHVQQNFEGEQRFINPAITPLTLKSLIEKFEDYFLHFKKGVLTAMGTSIAIIRSDPKYCMFDSHGRSPRGLPYEGHYKKAGALMIFQNYQDMAEAIIRIFCGFNSWLTASEFMNKFCANNFVILPVEINIIQDEKLLNLIPLENPPEMVSHSSPPSPPPPRPEKPSDPGFQSWYRQESGTHPPPPPPPLPYKPWILAEREAQLQSEQKSESTYPAHIPVYHDSLPPPLPRKPTHFAAPPSYSSALPIIGPMLPVRPQRPAISIFIPKQNNAKTQMYSTMPEPIVHNARGLPTIIVSTVYKAPESTTEPDIYGTVRPLPMPVPRPYSQSESSMPGINRALESPTTSNALIRTPVPQRPNAIQTFLDTDWSKPPEARTLPKPPLYSHTSSPTSPASTSERSLFTPPSQAQASPTSPTTPRNSQTTTNSARSPAGGRANVRIMSTPPPENIYNDWSPSEARKLPTPPERKLPTPPERKLPTPPERKLPTPPERKLPTPPERKLPTPLYSHTSSPTSSASTSVRSLSTPPSQAQASPTSPTTSRNSPTTTNNVTLRRLEARALFGGRPKPERIVSTPPPEK